MKRMIFLSALIISVASFAAGDTITQTTDSDFYAGTLNAVSVYSSGAAAYMGLSSGLQQLPGNSFVISGATDFPDYSMSTVISMPFSLPQGLTVTAVVLYNYWQGTAASYFCGIRADVDASGTSPDASGWLNPGSYNSMQNVLASGQSYYNIVTLQADTYLNSSTPYHIYIEGAAGVDNLDYCQPRGLSPNNKAYPLTGAQDQYQMVMQSVNSGASWSQYPDAQPVFLIEYLDPNSSFVNGAGKNVSYIGNPYYSYTDKDIYGGIYTGQEFTVNSPASITKFRVYLSSSAAIPADDLYIVIQDITDPLNIVLITDEVFIAKTDVFPGFSWQSHTLLSAQTLLSGHRYRVFFKSPLSASTGYYILRGAYVFQNASQDGILPAARLASATFGGSDSCLVYTTGSGTSWDNFNNSQDLLVMLSDSAYTVYSSNGSYTSPPFDTKGGSTFNRISWLPVTQTAQAGAGAVMFQAAANNDGSTWNFTGPDGTASTWFTDPVNSALPGIFGNKRYFRYRINMSTINTAYSPFVDEIDINYTARPSAPGDINLTNYPNPFNPKNGNTLIRYTLYENSDVTLKIFTTLSGPVREFKISAGDEGGRGAAGGYDNTVPWDGKNGLNMTVESGVYICEITVKSNNGKYKRKIAVLR